MSRIPSVKRQNIKLKVDVEQRTLVGWTEIVVAGGDGIHLHAYGLDILSIQVDGLPASFDYRKHQALASDQVVEFGEGSIKDLYISVLERDLEPELFIQFPPLKNSEDDSDRSIVICYQVCNPQAGVYFDGYVPKDKGEESLYPTGYAVVDNTIRRTSAWVPCVDVPSFGKEVEFNLALTVRDGLIAVGPGRLVKQTYSEQKNCDDGKWRTFWYEIASGASPCDLGFVIGPFNVESSSHKLANGGNKTIATHFAPKDVPSSSGLEHAAKMFDVIQSLYAEVLGVTGIPSHVQTVFLPEHVSRTDCEVFSGLSVLSTSSLCDLTSVEQSQRARLEQAWALARQWFGQFVRPATPGDVWLVEGLAAWLQEQFIRKYMGRTELAIRRWDRRLAVAAADDGTAAPLWIPSNDGRTTWRSSWGRLYGTERVDPSPLRSLKSAAVVAALERRAGEDLFRKHVESIFRNENVKSNTLCNSVVWLDATSFVMELGRAGDFRKEVGAFLERWVYGSGVSHIKAGYRFHRRGCYLELGIIQNGSAAALEAGRAAEKAAAFEGIGTGVIKVAVKEGSGALVEHPVHVGAQPYVVAELKVNPEVKKVALKRGRKRKDEEEQLAAQQKAAENAMHPVQWVRLDPGGEWLCGVQVIQPFRTLKNQLNDSKDVVAQIQAVVGMMDISLLGPSNSDVVGTLLEALNNDQFHWRVRAEAASVLSKLGNEGGIPVGLGALLESNKSRYWEIDAETAEETVKTTRFSDVSEYLLAQAIVRAVAQATKSTRWQNISEAAELLLGAVLTIKMCSEEYHSGWKTFSDSGMLSALCEALGDIRVPKADEEELGEIIARIAYLQLRRRLAMELVSPSPDFEVGCSCLQALVAAASSKACPSDVISEVAGILESYSNNLACPARLRQTAIRCLIRLFAVYNGLEKAFNFALSYKGLAMGNSLALWEELGFLASAESVSLGCTVHVVDEQKSEERSREVNDLMPLRKSLIGAVQSCVDVRLRHLMFVAWSRACGEPPALVTGPIDHRMPWLESFRAQSVVQGESEVNYQAVAGSLKVKLKVGEKGITEQDETEKVVADLQAPVNVEEQEGLIQNVQTTQPNTGLISSRKDEAIGATVLEATDGHATGEDGLIDGSTRNEPHKLKKQIKLKLNK